MTQHPSLKSGAKDEKFRSVLKRFEKVKDLSEKGKWEETKDSVYRLPKVKRMKFKSKKAAKEAVEEGAAAPGAVSAASAGAATPAKGAPAKAGAPGAKAGAPGAKPGAKTAPGKEGAAPAGGKK